MSTPHERLIKARIAKGYETASEAAEALGVAVSTYTQHENGTRGFTAKRALAYAKRFSVRADWLLYGMGPEKQDDPDPIGIVMNLFGVSVEDARHLVALASRLAQQEPKEER